MTIDEAVAFLNSLNRDFFANYEYPEKIATLGQALAAVAGELAAFVSGSPLTLVSDYAAETPMVSIDRQDVDPEVSTLKRVVEFSGKGKVLVDSNEPGSAHVLFSLKHPSQVNMLYITTSRTWTQAVRQSTGDIAWSYSGTGGDDVRFTPDGQVITRGKSMPTLANNESCIVFNQATDEFWLYARTAGGVLRGVKLATTVM